MFPQLATDRFLLKQILPEDQRFVFQGLSHPQVIPFYGVSYHSFNETRVQMIYYQQLYQKGTGAWWKIVDRLSGENIGAIGYYNYMPRNNKAEVGYWLLPQYWKKGVMKEALTEVIRYLQQKKGLHRLEAFVEEGNQASCAVLEKAGFVLEGTMRECEIKNNRYVNLLLYSLLTTDRRY